MQYAVKVTISLAVILTCTFIGKRWPSLAGLIATMPLTGLLVLVFLYRENLNNHEVIMGYTKGALFGIFPSIMFFAVAFVCFRKQMPLAIVMSLSFLVWLIGAFLHQWLLK